MCACACELGRAGFCLSHNVTLEEEAGRASCTFLPPLVSSSPPAPASSGSALRRHLHNKSPQVLGGERAGRAPVTRAPRRQTCRADPRKSHRHPNGTRQQILLPSTLSSPTIAGLPPSAPGCDPGGHLPSQPLGKSQSGSPMEGESKNLISPLKPISPTPHTSGRDCLGQRRGRGVPCAPLCA